jgi:DNA-binding transcriptional ArsR family regulator
LAAGRRPALPDADVVDARVVKALGHPTRVRILGVLRERDLVSPVELSSELGVPLGTVGYHVRRLEQLGFLELARRTQRRGAVEHHYRARAALDLPPSPPVGTADRGDGIEAGALVVEAQQALVRGGFDGGVSLADCRVLVLDAPARVLLAAAHERLRTALELIEAASARRLAAAGQRFGARCCTVAVARFDAPDLPADA